MNIAEIQKEIASTICLIGSKIIKNDRSFLRTIREDKNWFNEEGNIMSFAEFR